jgi:hypothetical protein
MKFSFSNFCGWNLIKKGALLLCVSFFLLGGCQNEQDASSTPALPPHKSVSKVELDIARLEPLFKAAYAKLDTQQFKNCAEIYATFFKKERMFLASWISGEPVSYIQKIPEKEIDEGLSSELCYAVANRDNRKLIDSTLAAFPENYDFRKNLTPLFTRLKSYCPQCTIPKIRFMASGYDPRRSWEENYLESAVALSEDYLGISSDYFLGEKFSIRHPETPAYIRKRCALPYLAPTVAHHWADKSIAPLPSRPTLLDIMVREGIKLYIVDILLPDIPDSTKFFITQKQAEWLDKNKTNIYHELLPILYETKLSKFRKYVADGGYCAAIGTQAPSRLASFCGLEITRSYMNANPKTTFGEILATKDYKAFFEKSNYKP